MNPVAIIADLHAIGVTLTANGDKLGISAPAGTLTPTWRRVPAEHKDGLLAHAAALRVPRVWRPRAGDCGAPTTVPPGTNTAPIVRRSSSEIRTAVSGAKGASSNQPRPEEVTHESHQRNRG